MKWYTVQFDPSWVACRNIKCRGLFITKNVFRKNKCPQCKMDNQGCITTQKDKSNDTRTN